MLCMRWLFHGVMALSCVCGLALTAGAQDNRGSKMVILKDPTPRDPDPDLLFKPKPAPEQEVQRAARLRAYNEQRLALVQRATAQVATLAITLEAALAAAPGKGQSNAKDMRSREQEIQVAGAIASLAANVHGALGPGGGPTAHAGNGVAEESAAKDARLAASELPQHAKELVRAAQDLHAAADRSRADTLSLELLRRSAEVHALAEDLQQRLAQEDRKRETSRAD